MSKFPKKSQERREIDTMLINELIQLDELRTALRAISAQLSSCAIHLDQLREKVESVYYTTCSSFNPPAPNVFKKERGKDKERCE